MTDETVEDVLRYIRIRADRIDKRNDECGHFFVPGDEPASYDLGDDLRRYADRIEAAVKREREAAPMGGGSATGVRQFAEGRENPSVSTLASGVQSRLSPQGHAFLEAAKAYAVWRMSPPPRAKDRDAVSADSEIGAVTEADFICAYRALVEAEKGER